MFLYNDASRAATLRVLGRYASNPELSFSWYDAAVLSQKIRQESQQRRPRVLVLACRFRPTAKKRRPSVVNRRSQNRGPRVATVSEESLAATIDRFLQSRVERNASPLTIKSYREDLDALAESWASGIAAAAPSRPT